MRSPSIETTRLSICASLRNASQQIQERWFEHQFHSKWIQDWEISGVSGSDPNWIRDHFIAPLFELFIQVIETSDESLWYLYLDERLRYAPHRKSAAERKTFFETLLQKDERACLDSIDPKQKDAARELFQAIHAPLLGDSPAEKTLNLLAIGDCLMNEIRVFLPQDCKKADLSLDMRCIYFSANWGAGLNTDEVFSFLEKNSVDLISLSFFSFEGIAEYSRLVKECDSLNEKEISNRCQDLITIAANFIDQIRSKTEVPLLIHNVSGLPLSSIRRRIPILPPLSQKKKKMISCLNSKIDELIESTQNTLLIDEYTVAKNQGYRQNSKSVVPRSILKQGLAHTSIFGKFLSDPYLKLLKTYQRYKKKKLLLVDFDNTLWQGVMADGKVDHFADRQKLLKDLKDAGILLVALSKNSIENIRWEEMLLQKEDFVLLKISWELKAKGAKETAAQLNLGINSFVFIDDNPAELELMRQKVPEVLCVDATKPETWEELRLLFDLPVTRQTEESKQRTQMYRNQVSRTESLSEDLDYPAMMASLELKAEFREAKTGELSRVHELVSRTNQFNTTTIRYSKNELENFMRNEDHKVFVSSLSDKFGKLGLVLVVIIEHVSPAESVIKSFIMSCRAMGFGLENLILNLVLADLQKQGVKTVCGEFIESDRNSPAQSLFSNNGFTSQSDHRWITEIDPHSDFPIPQWFKILP